MRSDRNPYFILSKSKKPEIQEWLAKASLLSVAEIKALKVKPDLQKAMLYVAQLKQQEASAGQAEQLADLMQQAHAPLAREMQIWRYDGSTTFVRQNSATSVDVVSGAFFGVENQKAFVNNCWIMLALNPGFLESSVYIEQGDATRLNILNQERRNKQYV